MADEKLKIEIPVGWKLVIDAVSKFGLPVVMACLISYLFYQKSEDGYKRIINENQEVKADLKSLRDQFTNYLINDNKSMQDQIRKNNELIEKVNTKLK